MSYKSWSVFINKEMGDTKWGKAIIKGEEKLT